MEPKICPFTGGLIFETPDEQEQTQKDTNLLVALQNAVRVGAETPATRAGERDINDLFNPRPSVLSLQERYELVMAVGEECIEPQELLTLLENKRHPIAYDGFEPSGRMHIAQGILRAINVNRLVDAGVIFIFWVADWFGLLNNKMGGDLDKIRDVGKYFVEVWRAAGMKMHNVKFLWASQEINEHANDYWLRVLNIARAKTVTRIKRCQQIMGRDEEGEMTIAQMLYPCMQASDIYHLKADICSLGLDQRKVNMLAREYSDTAKLYKPIILSHHMLLGLKEGQEKMSKSDADSAIFMEDSAADVERKIKKAFCPEKQIDKNPIIDYVKHIIFPSHNQLFIERDEKKWGVPSKLYKSYQHFEKDYLDGAIHPTDLKKAVIKAINGLIEPVRRHFETDAYARQLLQRVRSYQVTR